MKLFVLYFSLVLFTVVTADNDHDAPPDTERVSKHSAEISKSQNTDSPFTGFDIVEIKAPVPSKKSEQQQPPQIPKLLPIQANCFGSFPGTPTWNDCMRKFQEDMAENNRRIQEMSAAAAKMPQSGYSGRSSSNSIIGGYSIHTENIPSSNVVTNGVIKVLLFVNLNDRALKVTRNNRVITVTGGNDGLPKLAEIRIPQTVNVDKVEVTRSGETIVISGPVANGNAGSVQMSQSGGGFTWSSSNPANFPQVFPQMPMQPFNPFPPMQDFTKKVHGFLDGFHKNFFGFGKYQSPDYDQPKPRNNGGFVWFV